MDNHPKPLNLDFASLAIKDSQFAEIYTRAGGRIDFQNPVHLLQLTQTILKVNFDLAIRLPDNRLCPPVPIRYEYIRWLQVLLDTSSHTFTETYDPQRKVIGIDIGVGASCIYPLLGCASRPNWSFGGVEIDGVNYDSANRNVKLNGLEQRIEICKNDSESPLINMDGLGLQKADFVMCNPPFFTSREDMKATFTNKDNPPSAVCTGADIEMIAEGGDLGFVLRIFEESEKLKHRVSWYSSMFGKLSSANAMISVLKEKSILNYAVTCLQAGNVTKRWAVAWSFGDLRPEESIARGNAVAKNLLPFPSTFSVSMVSSSRDEDVTQRINTIMDGLRTNWLWNEHTKTGICLATGDVWSRAARRTTERANFANIDTQTMDVEVETKLGVRISLPSAEGEIKIQWLQGTDRVLFESFCGMFKRKMCIEK